MALTDKLTAIANAIREKTGSIEEMTLDMMATEISGITSGSNAFTMKDYLTLRSGDGYQFYSFKGTYEALSKILKYSDTSSVTNMTNMFEFCNSLTTIPRLDTSSVTNMNNMLHECSSLTSIPLLDTSSVTDMSAMFWLCTSLTTIPQLDTSSVTDMNSMFDSCTSLTTIPQLDTSSVTNMSYMFFNCTSLTTISQLDISSVTDMSNMLYGCSKLKDCYLRNIKENIQLSNGSSYGCLLTLDSLLYIIKELRISRDPRTLTIGSKNIEKINNIYIKLKTITDEMRAEDRWINEKFPFEVCESTDEGAIYIYDYCSEKNWQIK